LRAVQRFDDKIGGSTGRSENDYSRSDVQPTKRKGSSARVKVKEKKKVRVVKKEGRQEAKKGSEKSQKRDKRSAY